MKLLRNVFLLLFLITLFTGCNQASDFALKKECTEFSLSEQQREEFGMIGGRGNKHFVGIYYSKNMETCISEWYVSHLGEDYLDEAYLFYDVLTGENIEWFTTSDSDIDPPRQKNLQKKVKIYEKEIQLLIENEIQAESNFINIEYRDDDVDLNNGLFLTLNTSKSSWVNGAWYDENNQYMIIDLDGKYYHYCDLPYYEWNAFTQADSFGSYYSTELKGDYDCRVGFVPLY